MPEANPSQFHQFSARLPSVDSNPMLDPVDRGHLLIIEDDSGRKEFTLTHTQYSIGRDVKCDIRLFSHFVSRRHATLLQKQNEDGSIYYQIIDGTPNGAPSSNGIMVNGRKQPSHKLADQDEIIFGPQVSAKYYRLIQGNVPGELPSDEFDITLISPGMIDDPEEEY